MTNSHKEYKLFNMQRSSKYNFKKKYTNIQFKRKTIKCSKVPFTSNQNFKITPQKKSTQVCPHKSFEGVRNGGLLKRIEEIPKISLDTQ